MRHRILVLVAAVSALAACRHPMTTPVEQIPALGSLEEVMDNQATAIDPQFKKIGQASFSDADLGALAAASTRVQATSLAIKDKRFSKGADFDALATQLNDKAKALGTAAGAKDPAGVNTALADMKALCKDCHHKFR